MCSYHGELLVFGFVPKAWVEQNKVIEARQRLSRSIQYLTKTSYL